MRIIAKKIDVRKATRVVLANRWEKDLKMFDAMMDKADKDKAYAKKVDLWLNEDWQAENKKYSTTYLRDELLPEFEYLYKDDKGHAPYHNGFMALDTAVYIAKQGRTK